MICSSCGVLVGADDRCYNCGGGPRARGFAPLPRSLGVTSPHPFIIGTCVIVYVLTLIASKAC